MGITKERRVLDGQSKVQPDKAPSPEGLPPDASGPPVLDLARWWLRLSGLVGREIEWNWEEFRKLPHCVTRRSRLGNVWEGVSTRELIAQAGGVLPAAAYVMAYGYDRGWTNLALADFLSSDALAAFAHDGQPITVEHGGPARPIVPQLYA